MADVNPPTQELQKDFQRATRKTRNFSNLNAEEAGLGLLMVMLTKLFDDSSANEINGIEKLLTSIFGLDRDSFKEFRADIKGMSTHDAAKNVNYSKFNFNEARSIKNNIAEHGPKYSNMVATTGHPLLDLIAKHESNGDYNIAYGGKHKNFTDMTINEVIAWQKNSTDGGMASSAAGRYQFIRKTLTGLRDQQGLTGNELFDEKMQDRLASVQLNARGLDKFLSGKMDEHTFMKNLSKEWASLPKDMNGASYYAGDGLNKAGVSAQDTLASIKETRELFKNNFSSGETKVATHITPDITLDTNFKS